MIYFVLGFLFIHVNIGYSKKIFFAFPFKKAQALTSTLWRRGVCRKLVLIFFLLLSQPSLERSNFKNIFASRRTLKRFENTDKKIGRRIAISYHVKITSYALTRGVTRASSLRGGLGAVLYKYSNHLQVTPREAPPPTSEILIPQSAFPFVTTTRIFGTSQESAYCSMVALMAFCNGAIDYIHLNEKVFCQMRAFFEASAIQAIKLNSKVLF